MHSNDIKQNQGKYYIIVAIFLACILFAKLVSYNNVIIP